jgi:hypothetical protein
MKKFISALTSLAIATTALGGTLAMSANAATNTAVDKTIIEFRTGTSNEITAKAGDTIPVSVYVPQSSGLNVLALKFSINGDATLGVGVEETAEELALIHAEADKKGVTAEQAAAYKAVKHWLFGNYGITTSNEKYASPYCFDSGIYQAEDVGGGKFSKSMAYFVPGTWNINYTATTFVNKNKNADAFAPWKASGMQPDEDGIYDYSNYTPVYTWTKDEAWAYDYALATFDLNLPAGLADGTYTLDILKTPYINTISHQFAQSQVSGVNGDVAYESVPLVITVGEGSATTTSSSQTTTVTSTTVTTTSTTVSTNGGGGDVVKPETPAGTVEYNLIPRSGEYGFKDGYNTITVEPGAALKVDWTVKNDQGTAGMQMHFDFSAVAANEIKRLTGNAYDVDIQWNPETFAFVWGGSVSYKAEDGQTVGKWNMTAPTEPGTYLLTIKDTDGPNIVRPLEDKEPDIPFVFYGLAVTVEKAGATTTTTEQGTTTSTTTSTTTTVTTTESDPGTTTSTTTTTTTTSSSVVPVGDILWGDVNCDKQVRINDVVLLNKHLAGNATITAQGEKNADCEYDQKLDQKDSTAIKKFLAKLLTYDQLGDQSK